MSSLIMHKNKDEFFEILEQTSARTGFSLSLLEKDYYLTLLLSGIGKLSENLIFKGGTCLSKIYYSYYRLSEDLDFSMRLPGGKVTRGTRRNLMKPVKEKIESFAKDFDLSIQDVDRAGRNESVQYVYQVNYESAVLNKMQSIKLEISLRHNPVLSVSKQKAHHIFLHPFTKEPLFDGGAVNCLHLKELVAEKLRAAATRLVIAPRDFYDLGHMVKVGFNFKDKELRGLFKTKLAEDGFENNLDKYRVNLGRSKDELKDMKLRIESELFDVLTPEEKRSFNLEKTLDALNKVFKE